MSTVEELFGHYTPSKTYNKFFHLEMRQGVKSKMYTLRRVPSPLHPALQHAKEEHLTNLSTNKESAWLKAIKFAEQYGQELYDDSVDELRKIVRVSDGYMNFGKNEGNHVSELDDNYLSWVAEGGQIKCTDQYGDIYTKFLVCEELLPHALNEAVKRGIFSEFEGKIINVKKIEYILKFREGTGHHHKEGEKVELVLNVVSLKSFTQSFGYSETTTNILTLVSEEGLKYTYKGSINRYSKGDRINIKGTVKHSSYNGKDVTYLKNIKDVPTQAYKDFNKIKEGTIIQFNENDGSNKLYTVNSEIDEQAVTGVIEGNKTRNIFKDELNVYGRWEIIKF